MASCSPFCAYKMMILDEMLFTHALGKISRGGGGSNTADNEVSLHGLLLLLDLVMDMLADHGLYHILGVYKAVKKHSSVYFERDMLWQTCHLSGINTRGCVKLGDGIFVHSNHAKWVLCLWLVTHMREIERSRDCVPAAQATTYRKALMFVLEQLEGVYEHVSVYMKKNILLARMDAVTQQA